MMAREIRLSAIERTEGVILALLTLGSLVFWDWRITVGVILGGASASSISRPCG